MQTLPLGGSNKHNTVSVAVQTTYSITMRTYRRFVGAMFIFRHGKPSQIMTSLNTRKKTGSFIILIKICMQGNKQFLCSLVAFNRIFFQAC
jgi:hypothetical protein